MTLAHPQSPQALFGSADSPTVRLFAAVVRGACPGLARAALGPTLTSLFADSTRTEVMRGGIVGTQWL